MPKWIGGMWHLFRRMPRQLLIPWVFRAIFCIASKLWQPFHWVQVFLADVCSHLEYPITHAHPEAVWTSGFVISQKAQKHCTCTTQNLELPNFVAEDCSLVNRASTNTLNYVPELNEKVKVVYESNHIISYLKDIFNMKSLKEWRFLPNTCLVHAVWNKATNKSKTVWRER